MPRQTVMKDVVPPLTLPQERALEYLENKEKAKKASDIAKDSENDMVAAAQKAGVDVIKVRDDRNRLWVFQLDNKVLVKKTVLTDIKIEKQEKEALKK